jgi:alcohol dehydrogenase class IV
MVKFEISGPDRILFGFGTAEQVPELVREWGDHLCVVTGRHPERYDALLEGCRRVMKSVAVVSVGEEPSVELVLEALDKARAFGASVLLGLGGGSALDTAKAVAGLAVNPGDPFEYLEVVGAGKPLPHRALPWIAVPTTAGSGAEVTRNAVLASREHRVKVSLRSDRLFARTVVVDPLLTVSNPPHVTAWSGMDALVQVTEPLFSTRRNPFADGLCREALTRAAWALSAAFREGTNLEAREAMCTVSLFGGIALTQAGLGAVHGLAGPLGGMVEAPHGALCARLLPAVCRVNFGRVLQQRDEDLMGRFSRLGELLAGVRSGEAALEWIEERVRELEIPRLRTWGFREDWIPDLVERAMRAGSMKTNPVPLRPEDVETIIQESL